MTVFLEIQVMNIGLFFLFSSWINFEELRPLFIKNSNLVLEFLKHFRSYQTYTFIKWSSFLPQVNQASSGLFEFLFIKVWRKVWYFDLFVNSWFLHWIDQSRTPWQDLISNLLDERFPKVSTLSRSFWSRVCLKTEFKVSWIPNFFLSNSRTWFQGFFCWSTFLKGLSSWFLNIVLGIWISGFLTLLV